MQPNDSPPPDDRITPGPPPGEPAPAGITRGQWMALTAALLGWMFDGLEMGLFPVVARPALRNLLPTGTDDDVIARWIAVATAGFLVGAATGGVLFGWLGDRIGRVRAMTLSVLTYAIFSGAGGLAQSPEQIAFLRFLAALGMGGEWALGVALVMEVWPNRSRAWLAGLIGAAANVGYLIVAALALVLGQLLGHIESVLRAIGLRDDWTDALVAYDGWRILMLLCALPALLTFFIRLFVPESEKWLEQKSKGATSSWATKDLVGVLIGAVFGGGAIICLWAADGIALELRILGSIPALVIVTLGYLFPVVRYLGRSEAAEAGPDVPVVLTFWNPTTRRMLLGACLGGVALLGTWASIQQVPPWANKLSGGMKEAGPLAQICASVGAIIGTILAALLGGWLGRRITYFLLCAASLAAALVLFQTTTEFGAWFLVWILLAGGTTASFYGWLPLYLPELFRTKVRATGQGFSFNFGRIIAAVGALQGGYLIKNVFHGDYATVCSIMSLIYLVGMAIIWFAPETHGQPLPE